MTSPDGSLLVCFAMPEEARPFQKLLAAGSRPGVSVLITGMGRRNTERAFQNALVNKMPAAVLTCGFAGGLNPSLSLNDVVCETDSAALQERLRALDARPIRFHCAERMAVTAEEKATLRQKTGAEAVEMESRWIHELCRLRGLPCATVRVISDTSGESMPLDFNTLTTSEMTMSYSKLALALLRHPGKLPALLRLQRQTQTAAFSLAAFLQKFMAG